MGAKPDSVGRRKTVPQGTLCPICGQIHRKCAAHRRKIRDEYGRPIPCNQPVSFEEIRIATEEGRGAVCKRQHGGIKLVGPANPNYKHGNMARKRFLPSRFLEDADKIGNDPELGSMRHAIVVQELRIEELMRKLDEIATSGDPQEIQEALTDAKMALEIGDIIEATEFVQAALTISKNDTSAERQIWDEIRRTHKVLATMVDSERKRQIVVQDYIPRRQLVLLTREIIKTVGKYIPDPRAFSQFTLEIANKIGANNSLNADTGGSVSLNAEFRRLEEEHEGGVEGGVNNRNSREGRGGGKLSLAEYEASLDSDDDEYGSDGALYDTDDNGEDYA